LELILGQQQPTREPAHACDLRFLSSEGEIRRMVQRRPAFAQLFNLRLAFAHLSPDANGAIH
jgi:hypothetical protein